MALLLAAPLFICAAGPAFAALPANGVQDITDLMANGSPTLSSFPAGFTYVNNSNYNYAGDTTPGANGIYPNVATLNASTTFTVNADGVNLGTFDLTGINFTNFSTTAMYNFTVTGFKPGGGTVSTTFYIYGTTFSTGNFAAFTGITGFQYTFVNINNDIPANITFDNFTIANAAVPATAPGAPTAVTATAGNTQATVNFTAPASNGGAAITTYTATSNPGGLTGSCAGPAACAITVGGLTNGTPYTFTVTATNYAGTSAASSPSNSITPKANQTITFNNPGTQTFGTAPTLTATATSGLAVSFTSSTTGVCTVTTGGALTFVGAGTCTINADQAGSSTFNAAPTVTQSFAVNAVLPGAPTIGTATAGNGQASVSFTAPASNGGSAITGYTATSSPGGFTGSCASSPCTVAGLSNGTAYTFTVTATNSVGTGSASGVSNSVTPATVPGAPTIGTATAGNAQATVSFTAPASNGGSAITGYTATSSPGNITSSCATSPCTVTGLSNGTAYTFTVTASNAVGTGAASAASAAVTPVTLPGAPTGVTAAAGNTQATVNFTAPASNGGSAITTYTATSSPGGLTGTCAGPAACAITVGGLSNGTSYTFTVTATSAVGTGAASTASGAVTPKAPQTITFNNPGAQTFGTAPTLTATATSGLTVSFTSSTAGVCTVTAGGALTFVTAGTCSINADQVGNASFTAATTVTQSFTVNAVVPGAPTIGTATAGNTQAAVAFTAPASNGGAAITGYTATSNPGNITGTCASSPCTVSGLSNGTAYTFTVSATSSAGTGSASAASNSVIPAAPQTITFTNPGAQTFGTAPTLTATATSGLTVSFTSSTAGVCTVTAGGALTFVAAGTCSINADQVGNASFTAAPTVTQSFTVNAVVPGAPTIGTATAGNAQASVSFTAPASNGGAAITGYTVTSSPGGVTGSCASSPCTVTGLSNGTAYTFTVTATSSAGTGSASAASNSVTPAASQTITFNNPGAQNFGTAPTLTATATSGLTVSFTSSTAGVCTVTAGGALTFVTAGTCSINADQVGNASFTAATTVTQSFTVNAVVPGAPTIGTATAGNTTVAVAFTAPASNGGAAITGYTVTSSPGNITGTCASSPCTVSGLSNGTAYTFTVTATNSAGTGTASAASNSVTPAGLPTVTGVSPSGGPTAAGTAVTITGTFFSGATSVTIGGVAATGVTVINSTTITATAPAGTAGTANVVVTTAFGSGTGAGLYTYYAAPAVTGISPNVGTTAGGTSVTITGANFSGATGVTIGGAAATGVVVNSATQITATTPAGTAGAANVLVITPGGSGTGSGLYTYATAPGAPTGVTATPGNARATVTFTAPASNGNSAITSYTATSNPGGLTGSCAGPAACAITVTGLSNGTAYTFTVTAINALGTGATSAASAAVTPTATPVANAAAIQYQLNTPVTLDLAPFITGTSVNITTTPAHGTVTVAGTVVTYTPVNNYFGNDSFAYAAVNGGNTSVAATVRVTFNGTRPDPTHDANVSTLVTSQAQTAKLFWRAQVSNYQQRLEFLHHTLSSGGESSSGFAAQSRPVSMAEAQASQGGGFQQGNALTNRAQLADLASQPNAPAMLANGGSTGTFANLVSGSLVSALTTSSITLNMATITGSNQPVAVNDAGRIDVWGAGNVRVGTKSQPGSANIDYSTDGVSFGADRRFGNDLTLGIGVGYAHDKSKIGIDGSGSTSNGNSVAVYGSYQYSQSAFLDGLLGYGKLSLDSTRYVASMNDFAYANRGGSQVFGSLSSGYEYRDRKTLFSPYARYDFAMDRLDAATERGAGIAALAYGGQVNRTQQLSFGLRAQTERDASFGTVLPRARVEYQHHLEGNTQATIAYADLLGSAYTMAIPATNSNYLLLGLGSGFALKNGFNLDLDLQWMRGSGSNSSRALFFKVTKQLGGK